MKHDQESRSGLQARAEHAFLRAKPHYVLRAKPYYLADMNGT
jgi:hypothetical protein